MHTTLSVVDRASFQAIDARRAALAPAVKGLVRHANRVSLQQAAALPPAPTLHVRSTDHIGALHTDLTRIRADLDRKRWIPNEPIETAIKEALVRGRTLPIPDEEEIAIELGAPPYYDEYAIYALLRLGQIANEMGKCVETVSPVAIEEIHRLTEPVVQALLDNGKLAEMCGGNSLDQVAALLATDRRYLRNALQNYSGAQINIAGAVVSKIRAPVAHYRPDWILPKLGTLVRKISATAKENTDLEKMTGWTRVREGLERAIVPRPVAATPATLHEHLASHQQLLADEMERAFRSGPINIHGSLADIITQLKRELELAEADLRELLRQHVHVVWGDALADNPHRDRGGAWRAAIARVEEAAQAAIPGYQAA